MLAEEWQLGDVLVRLLVLLFWVFAAWIFISAFADLFKRRDMSGGGKAAWVLLIVIFPVFGSLIYIATRKQPGEFDADAERVEAMGRHLGGKTV